MCFEAAMSLAKKLVRRIASEVAACPLITAAVYDSFEFTCTGENHCHPRTWGLIVKAAWELPRVGAVEIDARLNKGTGLKFQPDVLVRDSRAKITLAIDFESPNSSDARVPVKDVAAYLKWAAHEACPPEYLIITSLPNAPAPHWELRWTARGKYNVGHAPAPVRMNPFEYWYSFYRRELPPTWVHFPITFANFNGNMLSTIEVSSLR
jgi:hypothetical protein